MVTLNEVREGSIVMVRGGFGSDPARRATVTGLEEDIKNGQPGIDYELADGEGHWAYMHQVTALVQY